MCFSIAFWLKRNYSCMLTWIYTIVSGKSSDKHQVDYPAGRLSSNQKLLKDSVVVCETDLLHFCLFWSHLFRRTLRSLGCFIVYILSLRIVAGAEKQPFSLHQFHPLQQLHSDFISQSISIGLWLCVCVCVYFCMRDCASDLFCLTALYFLSPMFLNNLCSTLVNNGWFI